MLSSTMINLTPQPNCATVKSMHFPIFMSLKKKCWLLQISQPYYFVSCVVLHFHSMTAVCYFFYTRFFLMVENNQYQTECCAYLNIEVHNITFMDGCLGGWMVKWMDGWMNKWTDGLLILIICEPRLFTQLKMENE